MLQLELPYQKLWFRLRHPQGRMKLTTLRITEQLAIMEARVYLDRSDVAVSYTHLCGGGNQVRPQDIPDQ